MEGKIKILTGYFCDGTAEYNRLLAYAQGLTYHGIETEIVAFRVLKFDKKPNNIKVIGLWPTKINCKYFRYPLSFICLAFYLLFITKKKDKIILYANGEYLPLFIFLRNGNVWHEMTESPRINGRQRNNLQYYYKCCSKIRGIFVISHPLKELYIKNGVKPDRIHIINMIVDPQRFDNVSQKNHAVKYIAYCGNIYDDKKDGISNLLRVFAEYHKFYKDRYLYIAGKIVSKELKEKYDQFLCDQELTHFVKFCGMVSPKEIPNFLSNAEMLMLTRPDNEQAHYGFPTKLGEYLLSSRPVIVSDVGDIRNYLLDGKNAFVVLPENDMEFVKRMKWISENPIEANEIGEKGRECALCNFSNIEETAKIIKVMNM